MPRRKPLKAPDPMPSKAELALLDPAARRRLKWRIYHERYMFKHPEANARGNALKRKRYAEDPEYRERHKAASTAHRDRNWDRFIARTREIYAAEPLRFREYRLVRAYGITQKEWEALFDAQGRVCAVCSTDKPGGRRGWSTDHNHATGKIRGILCNGCNAAIGGLGDSVEGLTRALEYLKRSESRCDSQTTQRPCSNG